MIEADEIFQQVKEDSQTQGQVITETNYIIDELKEYRNSYAESLEKCRYCSGNLKFINDKTKEIQYLECEDCHRINKTN